jgi:hypothetical protein
VVKANAVQHLCYNVSDPVKQQIRLLGGIPLLLGLISKQPDVHRNACGMRSAHRWTIQCSCCSKLIINPCLLEIETCLMGDKRLRGHCMKPAEFQLWYGCWHGDPIPTSKNFWRASGFLRARYTKAGPHSLNGAAAERVRDPTILKIIGFSPNRFSHWLIGRNVKSAGIEASQALRL